MGTPVDRKGTYRGTIVEYGAQRNEKTNTWSLVIETAIEAAWDPGNQAWVDWSGSQVEAEGFLNLIKRDGNWNESQVSSIALATGWDGTFNSIQMGTWKPAPCQFDIKPNTYNGETTFRIEWLAPYDRVPGARGNLNADSAKSLDATMASSARAIIGAAQRQVQVPDGAPKAPPQATPQNPPPAVPPEPNDGIPF